MVIQRTNNSPSFQAIQLSTKESRKAAQILRKYKHQQDPKLKEQLVDIFTPHFEKEAELHEGVLKQDFIQDLFVKLFESLDKVNIKFSPCSNLVSKLNAFEPTPANFLTNHQSIETLTNAEKSKLIFEEKLLKKYDATNIVKKGDITPRYQYILLSLLDGKLPEEIGKELKISAQRVNDISKRAIKILNHEPQKIRKLSTDFDPSFKIDNEHKNFIQRILEYANEILDHTPEKYVPGKSNTEVPEGYTKIRKSLYKFN